MNKPPLVDGAAGALWLIIGLGIGFAVAACTHWGIMTLRVVLGGG